MSASRSVGPIRKLLDALEAILDAGDAVRRRKRADRIYGDMANQRISHPRAARDADAVVGAYFRHSSGGLLERDMMW